MGVEGVLTLVNAFWLSKPCCDGWFVVHQEGFECCYVACVMTAFAILYIFLKECCGQGGEEVKCFFTNFIQDKIWFFVRGDQGDFS